MLNARLEIEMPITVKYAEEPMRALYHENLIRTFSQTE